jgi:hypothetical protein
MNFVEHKEMVDMKRDEAAEELGCHGCKYYRRGRCVAEACPELIDCCQECGTEIKGDYCGRCNCPKGECS